MFLPVPSLIESKVSGVTIEVEHIQENIAEVGAQYLADEQLRMNVQYDGSNPFYGRERLGWQFIFVAPLEDATFEMSLDNPTVNLFCIPFHTKIMQVVVTERSYNKRYGMWLHLDLEGNLRIPYMSLGLFHHELV